MYNLGQELWQLMSAIQNLDSLDNEELFGAYRKAYEARHYSMNENVSETERRWATKVFEDIEAEMESRGLTVVLVCVFIDRDGRFISGRDELKEMFTAMSFDEMVDLSDKVLQSCKTDKQREAIIELEREVVTMAN